MTGFWSYSIFAVIAFLSTLLVLPLIMRLAIRLDLLDRPAHRKIHEKSIPFLGGGAIFLGIFVSGCFFSQTHSVSFSEIESGKLFWIIGISSAAAILGLLDDKFQIRARYKLLGQVILALMFSVFAWRFEVVRIPGIDPLLLGVLEVPFTVLWILTITNGINLIDGVDGLAGSVAAVILLSIAISASILGDKTGLALASAGFGALSGFLLLNWRPAKIYLGDSGSMGLGVFISCLLISLGTKSPMRFSHLGFSPSLQQEPFLFHVPAASLIAFYPVLEVMLSVLRRILKGKPIGSADQSHIHHKLLANSWTAANISLAAAVVSLVAGSVLWVNLAYTRGAAAWLLLLSGALMGILLHYCGYLRGFTTKRFRDSRPHFIIANHFAALQISRLTVAANFSEIEALVHQTAIEFGISEYAITINNPSTHLRSHLTWRNPLNEPGNILKIPLIQKADVSGQLIDQIALADSRSNAHWKFLPRQIAEDINIEHRVLVSGFFRAAIRQLENSRAKRKVSASDMIHK
ncbi:MAG: hypothetical protein A2Z97_00670 [Bdellovibrionales bacterium GWB1_52_6]|nr:MAG: hypothetical protein A2Z97_00670 [Bdellovibrionales bacterium GWB1_52_6]OFZ05224.1 MAG: hypothetical protein A2X97_10555 [Bdellovibrionales bacterium GWA1_52_35]HCM38644.1 hypothetical protein [Bdellovibrionales bacterium]